MKKLQIICIISMLIITIIIPQIQSTNQNLLINLDCNQLDGLIHHYCEINCGPMQNHDKLDGAELTNQYKEIGIDFIRTHDFNGPTDISTIFPDFTADEEKESSYNFTSSDIYIKSIIQSDSEVFYRLGESASDNKSLREPPVDFEKWANICKHVIMHYNDGWAEGYHYNISYWEIWNEPDLTGFWNGSIQDYYTLYRTTAEIIKEYNPILKVGGPCTSSIYNENFTTKFLHYNPAQNL